MLHLISFLTLNVKFILIIRIVVENILLLTTCSEIYQGTLMQAVTFVPAFFQILGLEKCVQTTFYSFDLGCPLYLAF